jgi:hypothetical protein
MVIIPIVQDTIKREANSVSNVVGRTLVRPTKLYFTFTSLLITPNQLSLISKTYESRSNYSSTLDYTC